MRRHRHSPKRRAGSSGSAVWKGFCAALVLIIVALSAYILSWQINVNRIHREGARYRELYAVGSAALPASAQPTHAPTAGKTAAPTPLSASETPQAAVSTAAAVPASGPEGSQEPSMPVVLDEPIPTPDAKTVLLSLPTPPPVQSSFNALLALNGETVGCLDMDGMLSLPVVQRLGDNSFYLDHNFEGADALEGTLFLDGMNRLVPEDDCLIIYGHNMKNGTMFGNLSAYAEVRHLQRHPIVHFDTLYENRSYVVFAAFSASMQPGDPKYFDVRQFIFDELDFEKFVLKLQSRSLHKVPLDVRYGDRLLLLVTCDYSQRDGRFILALRQMRKDENEGDLWANVMAVGE